MQQQLFNPLKEIILEISHIQYKVNQLKKMQMATDYSDIKISFKSGSDKFTLIQLDTDLSLVHELRLIIQESIDLYEQQLQELKLNF